MKISIILYKSKTLADGSHPLMVRISQLKDKKYFSTGLSCSSELWDFNKHTPKSLFIILQFNLLSAKKWWIGR
jgi:hypothetical protein